MRRLAAPAILLLAGLLAYLPVLSADFAYDDDLQVRDNPLVHSPGGSLLEIFSQPFPHAGASQELYRPLTIASLRWNAPGGRVAGPAFHAVNLALHLLTGLLFYRLLRRFDDEPAGPLPALFAAGWFVLGVTRSEPTAWISGRSELLVGLFSVGLLLLARRDLKSGPLRPKTLALMAPTLLAGLLCKESMAAMLLVLLALQLAAVLPAERRTERGRALAGALGILGLPVLLYGALRAAALSNLLPETIVAGRGAGLWERLGAGGRVLWEAPVRLVYLAQPSVEYWWPMGWTWQSLLGWALALTAAVWSWRTRSSLVRTGLFVTYLGLSPYLHVIPFGELFAERFLYLPSVGAGLLAFALARHLAERPRARSFALLAAAWLLMQGVQTHLRAREWKDNASLWEATHSAMPGSSLAITNLSRVRADQGRFDEALALLDDLETLPGHDLDACRRRLRVLGQAGRHEQAIARAQADLIAWPDDPELTLLLTRHLRAVEKMGHSAFPPK